MKRATIERILALLEKGQLLGIKEEQEALEDFRVWLAAEARREVGVDVPVATPPYLSTRVQWNRGKGLPYIEVWLPNRADTEFAYRCAQEVARKLSKMVL